MNIAKIYRLFPTEADCIAHIEGVRWHGTPVCPYCGSDRATPMRKEFRHHCNNCKTSFSATVKTIFHHTHLPLQKWFLALSLILNAKKGIAARELARDLEVNKDTAWFMAMRIRRAMEQHPINARCYTASLKSMKHTSAASLANRIAAMMKPRTISVDAAPRSSQLLARSNVAEMSSLGLYRTSRQKL